MLKDIVEALKVMGLEVPMWIGFAMLITAIVVGIYVFISKKFIPWIKKMIKIQEDILSIPELRNSTNKCDKMIMDEIKGISESVNKLTDVIVNMQGEMVINTENQKAQSEALKMMLANELDKRYRRYLELQYVPDSEFDEYVHMFESYSNLGGNGSGKQKYDYIMQHLERKI